MNWKNMVNEKSRTEYSVVNMTVAFIAQEESRNILKNVRAMLMHSFMVKNVQDGLSALHCCHWLLVY